MASKHNNLYVFLGFRNVKVVRAFILQQWQVLQLSIIMKLPIRLLIPDKDVQEWGSRAVFRLATVCLQIQLFFVAILTKGMAAWFMLKLGNRVKRIFPSL